MHLYYLHRVDVVVLEKKIFEILNFEHPRHEHKYIPSIFFLTITSNLQPFSQISLLFDPFLFPPDSQSQTLTDNLTSHSESILPNSDILIDGIVNQLHISIACTVVTVFVEIINKIFNNFVFIFIRKDDWFSLSIAFIIENYIDVQLKIVEFVCIVLELVCATPVSAAISTAFLLLAVCYCRF